MSSETYSYKGISAGKYVEGSIDALNREEASFKLKEFVPLKTTLLPYFKKVSAISKPIPLLEPVTKTVLSLNSKKSWSK